MSDDAHLRGTYRRLQDRASNREGPGVPLETVQALAENRLGGADRDAALDAVMADPAARQEYLFLRDLVRAGPVPAAGRWRLLALAATLTLAVSAGLLIRAVSHRGPEPLRGAGSGTVLLSPADGAALSPGDTLRWRVRAGAEGYVVEVVSDGGEVVYRTETTDTLAAFSPPAVVAAGPGQWWVTARLGGSSTVRSPSRRVQLTP